MTTIGEALGALEERLFVGRERDLEMFRRWLTAESPHPEILNVTGPGGVGKSALLGQFRRIAERVGRPVVLVDSRSFPPTPEGLLVAMAGAPAGGALERINEARPLLLLDTFEDLEELTRYLQEELLPGLDTDVNLVIAGRFPLGMAWGPWQKIIRPMPLFGFTEAESRDYLQRRGIEDPTVRVQIRTATGGHPLAVSLAADLVQQLGVRTFQGAPEWHLTVRGLVERLLEDVKDPELREMLEACSVVRTFDEAMLAAILGRDGVAEAFNRLCRLSVVRAQEHGLTMHDDVRRILSEDLRWRQPDRYRELRLRALAHYRDRARTATSAERQWLVAERLYTWGNDVVNALMFHADEPGRVYVDPGRPEDHEDVVAIWSFWLQRIVAQQQSMDYTEFTPEEDAAWLRRLLAHPAIRLRVARDLNGNTIGFNTALPVYRASGELLLEHPLFARLVRSYFPGDAVAALPESVEATPYHYLLHAAHTDVMPEATEAVLLRDLVGLFALGGVYLTMVSIPPRKRLLEAMGFEWVKGARQWVWDREHPADGYVLDLSGVGVEAWIEAVVSGRRPPRGFTPEELEEEVRTALAAWDDDAALAGSALTELVAADGPVRAPVGALARAVRELLRDALERAQAEGEEDQEAALRAVEIAYMDRGMSNERAAERLLVSRSTFYRLRKRGTAALARTLRGA